MYFESSGLREQVPMLISPHISSWIILQTCYLHACNFKKLFFKKLTPSHWVKGDDIMCWQVQLIGSAYPLPHP
jgi:hypothetical protein